MGEPILIDLLTDREMEILRLLAERLSNREIAQRLHLSLETIKWYNRQIYSKLDVGSRTEAVQKADSLSLFEDPDQLAEPAPKKAKNNLPPQIASFIGRVREISELKTLLHSNRLITLTGPGGSGKTRLALNLAESVLYRYKDGVFFINLLAADKADQVAKVIAQELALIERPNQPIDQILRRYLASKEILLLLDNFEHVQEAALLVNQLLLNAPLLTVLATSREALHLTAEQEYLVPPLTMPDQLDGQKVSDLLDYEAVQLFVQRARGHYHNFQITEENGPAVAGICMRLDGLPLAIELAAARIKLLTPEQIYKRLTSRLDLLVSGPRDLPDRQRTLRSTIDWSYQLLDEEEQRFFARLAVFNDGRSIAAVESVCTPGLEIDPINGLSSLLDKNLLIQDQTASGEPRFYMLETIQEYASEQLASSGQKSEINDRHLQYFLSLAEAMEPGYLGHEQMQLLDQTGVEMGNLRKAFAWAMNSRKVESAARLVSAIDYYFRYRDNLVEGYQMMRSLLPYTEEMALPVRVRYLLGIARLAWYSHDFDNCNIYASKSQELAQELGDKRLFAWALMERAYNPQNIDELNLAQKNCEHALQLFLELDDKPGITYALNLLGEFARLQGNWNKAQKLNEKALEMATDTGETNRQDMLRGNLGMIAYYKGEFERSLSLFKDIVRFRTKNRIWQWTIASLVGVAGGLSGLGQTEKAVQLLSANFALLQDYGIENQPDDQPFVAQVLSDVKAQLDEETFAAAWAEGQKISLEEAVNFALEN